MAGTYRCRQLNWHDEEFWNSEKFALNLLPVLFHIDCAFFLCRPWVVELLTARHDRGEENCMRHAFFGTPKNHKQLSYGPLLEHQKRNEKLASAAQRLEDKKNKSKDKSLDTMALAKKSDKLGRNSNAWIVVGKNNAVGKSTVRAAYDGSKFPFDPRLLKLFSLIIETPSLNNHF